MNDLFLRKAMADRRKDRLVRRALLLVCVAAAVGCQRLEPPILDDSQLTERLSQLESNSPQRRAAVERSLRSGGTNVWLGLVRMIGTTREREELAVRGFEVLGNAAEPAIPALANLLTNSATASEAAMCLSAIGSPSVPVLLAGLTNHDSIVRSRAAAAFAAVHPPATQAVFPLVEALQDEAPVVRTCAAWALGQMKLEPTVVIPKLVARINDTNCNTRLAALRAIGAYGSSAKAAIPQPAEHP